MARSHTLLGRTRLRASRLAGFSLGLALLGCDNPPEPQLSTPDGASFASEVYPVLLRDCAFSTCHGMPERYLRVVGPGRVRLDPAMPAEDPATLAELTLSYDRARSMLATGTGGPEATLLLQKPLEQAAGGQKHLGVDDSGRNVYRSRLDPGYQALLRWATTFGVPPSAADVAPAVPPPAAGEPTGP